jgi:hypothetical protein
MRKALTKRSQSHAALSTDWVLGASIHVADAIGWLLEVVEPRLGAHLMNQNTVYMHRDIIQVPEKGTYKWQLFNYWSDEFRQTQAEHSAYIALNFAGALDVCRSKLHKLIQHHRQQARKSAVQERHHRAIERLQNTMTGAAMAYENGFRQH